MKSQLVPGVYRFSKDASRQETAMADQRPTPNDQRSNVKNPNNPAQKADQANRAKQGGQGSKKPSK